jgi:hypothetical protein
MRTGYVAFLDVLGFSALISGDQGARVQKYLDCLKQVFDGEPESPVDYVVFSDSIILTTRDDEIPTLQALLARCSTLLWVMLANDIALRGAIAHGSYITEKTSRGTFVAGRAIIEAYHFEGAQDWIGIMLAPSVIQAVPDLKVRCLYQDPYDLERWQALTERLPWAAFVQPCLEIPFRDAGKSVTRYHGFAIVPTSGNTDPAALRDSLASTLDRLVWLKSLAPNPQVQAKYDRTHSWVLSNRGNWHMAAFRREQNSSW